MSELFLIYKQELLSFLKSGKSSLLLLAFTTLAWGGFITNKIETIDDPSSYLWVLFFSLVAGAGLTTSVFVRERVSATLEVLLHSGLERNSILLGKLLFTTSMTLLVGVGAFSISFIVRSILYKDSGQLFDEIGVVISLYSASTILVSNSSALLSMVLSNPRLVQFVNFSLLTVVSVLFGLFSPQGRISLWILSFSLIILSAILFFFTKRAFRNEKIIQPLIY